jgi:energy-coupling factor transporter ATP-binding protein EcfA2
MRVIATAGHAGHGKSTLVRALTGMDPHPAAPQRPAGLAAGLGLAWMTLPQGERLAFVDVPGQERLVPIMLAGVGSVPAVLFVVAADQGSPDVGRLRQLRLDVRAIAAADRAGLLLQISDQIVLAPGADAEAGRVLAGLPQPFTAAQARQALHTTRRVAIPLLEFLDRAGITERLPDDRRRLRGADSGGDPPRDV